MDEAVLLNLFLLASSGYDQHHQITRLLPDNPHTPNRHGPRNNSLRPRFLPDAILEPVQAFLSHPAFPGLETIAEKVET